MGLFTRTDAYDRARILADAARAEQKKRRRKAIALYRRVLAFEPENADLHARLAPLLAQTGQTFDALQSYRHAAEGCLRSGRGERAVAVYREAARRLPGELEVWRALGDLLHAQDRDPEAILALLEGRRQFRSRELRPQAIFLLRRVRQIDAAHVDAVLDLAHQLARSRQVDESSLLLQGLAGRAKGRNLRRIRAAQFRIEPTPSRAWRWLRAALKTSGREEAPRAVARPTAFRN
jgi:tetratricopeptide (TPR) repeat protein